jgi:hypothetical protein
MIRVFTDFQAIDSSGALFILKVDHEDLERQAQTLGIKVGDQVILDTHEDFELMGTLDFRFVDSLRREAWIAHPDWSTRRDKPVASELR